MRRGRLGIGIKVSYLVTNFKENKQRRGREGGVGKKKREGMVFSSG